MKLISTLPTVVACLILALPSFAGAQASNSIPWLAFGAARTHLLSSRTDNGRTTSS
ncbi:MAG: hypothetical protein ABI446_02655 [Gemmatimonadaceae bacterium]